MPPHCEPAFRPTEHKAGEQAKYGISTARAIIMYRLFAIHLILARMRQPERAEGRSVDDIPVAVSVSDKCPTDS